MWNTETEKQLIIFVSQMPAIYDSRPPKLKGKQLIEKKWIEISQLMNSTFSDLEFTAQDCESQWTKLRIAYGRHRKILQKQTYPTKQKWVHYQSMHSFMAGNFKQRNTQRKRRSPLSTDSDANSADHVAEMLEFTVTTDDADSSRNEGTPVKEEMHDDCATWKQSSQSLPMQCLNLPSGIAQPLNHTNGNVRLLNCQNGMTEALHPPGFPPLRKILPKTVMPEVNSIPYETLQVTPTQVQPVQVDPLGLCLSKDINSLPLDIRAKCIAEVYGVISRYVDQSMKKKDDSSPGCLRCRDYIYE